MKKIVIFVAMIILSFSLFGCKTLSGIMPAKEKTQEEEMAAKPTPIPESQKIAPGGVITTENIEITINKIEFTNKVLPNDTTSYNTWFESDEGKVFLHIDVDVKNLHENDRMCDSIMSVTVDYNDGYTYTAFAVPEDGYQSFSDAYITSIASLQTLGVRLLTECPDEVETSTDKPLLIIFRIDGEEYFYQMR